MQALAHSVLPSRPAVCPRPGGGAAPRRPLPLLRATTGSGGGLETSVSLGPGGPTGRASPAPGTSSKAAALSLDDVDITSEVCVREREERTRRERRPNFARRLGPSLASPAASAAPSQTHANLSFLIQAGIDWAPLRTALAASDFRAADDEHRARLIALAGPAAVARGWVYFSEVKSMPATDLRVMDALWRAASGGKFGFSAQREVRERRREERTRRPRLFPTRPSPSFPLFLFHVRSGSRTGSAGTSSSKPLTGWSARTATTGEL